MSLKIAMSSSLSDEVLAKFDSLCEKGIIHYGPSIVVPLIDETFSYEIRLCPSWSKKPLTVTGDAPSEGSPAKFGPGSDINLSHPDQVIGIVNDTHTLALNIYPVFRPQYLLLSIDSYRQQQESLDLQDLQASWDLLRAEGGEKYYVMYNCAQEAGCSRNHKHVQIVQKPEFSSPDSGFRFFPDVKNSETMNTVPYVYFLAYIDQNQSMNADGVRSIYQEMLVKCRQALGIEQNDEETVCPHNMVLTNEWMMMIPRRLGAYKGIMANAAGMLGMPTVATEGLLALWKKIGPSKALSEFGVAREGAE